jgi:WD40 repeat protein
MLVVDPRYCSAVFSPDGKYIAGCHYDGMVRVWEVRTGQLMRRVTMCTDWFTDVAFTPDGEGLITAGLGMTLWDISSLNASGFRARSETMNDSNREASELEEQPQPEREFSSQEVCSLYSCLLILV